MKPIVLDQDDWIRDYKVECEADGEDKRPVDIGYDDPRVQTHPLHIWTKYAFDDCDCVCPHDEDSEEADEFWDEHTANCPQMEEPDIFCGAGWVNRMEYYFSEIPFKAYTDVRVY